MMKFFDANVVVGRPQRAGIFSPVADGAALRAHLDAKGIARALVFHWAQLDSNPLTANPLVDRAVAAAADRLAGCWAVLPPLADPMITPDFFERMGRAGAMALEMMPKAHRYVLDPLTWKGFIDDEARRDILYRNAARILAPFVELEPATE